MFRGKYTKFAGGQQECVRRRATMSVSMNPNCQVRAASLHVHLRATTCHAHILIVCFAHAQAIADKVVGEVFAKCYADELPFNAEKKTTSFDK
jgi:hypothetical protein